MYLNVFPPYQFFGWDTAAKSRGTPSSLTTQRPYMKNSFIILSQLDSNCNSKNHSRSQLNISERSPGQNNQTQRQLPLFNSPQSTQNYPLTIEALPDALQWWNEVHYWLIHKDSGLRVPGNFTEKEALKIQEASKCWDWTVDTRDQKVACGLNLLALAEIVCQGGQN